MKSIIYLVCISLYCVEGTSQTTVEKYLAEVEKNNKSIVANKKYWASKAAGFATGLTLYDPQIEYDYLFGYPAGSGNQKDFTISQRMEFPTAYARKKSLSRQQVLQAGLEQSVFRQDILLKAKLLCLEKIYLNRKAAFLERRTKQAAELQINIGKKLERGEATVLDLNKIKLEALELNHERTINGSQLENVQTRLNDLNGGITFIVADTLYPVQPQVGDFETMDSTIEANDPIIKVYDQEMKVAEQQIKVQQAMRLPSMEFGYHSQTILGQSYRGVHTGIIVPLWENRNKLKASRLELEYTIANTNRHREEHRCENKELHNRVLTRKQLLSDYQHVFAGLASDKLLGKALEFGELTVVEYITEQRYFQASYNKLLEIELDYHQACAALFKISL